MGKASESGNGTNRQGALSLDPVRLKPVPAVLFLSRRRRRAGARGSLRRQIGVVGIAWREMTEGRHDIVAPVATHGAKNIAWLSRRGVGAFEKGEVAGSGGT